MFQMFADTQSANHLAHPVFQTSHSTIVQMVPMVVTDYQIINIRHILRFINIGSLEWFIDKGHRGSHAEYRVNQNTFSVYLDKVRGMPEPDEYIFITLQFMQVRFNGRNCILRSQSFRLAEQERKHSLKEPFIRRHHRCLVQIAELTVTVMGRTFDSLQALTLGQPAEARLIDKSEYGNAYYCYDRY